MAEGFVPDNWSEEMQDLARLMQTQEDLHPDLAPYVCKSSIGQAIKHPLMFEIFYMPQMNAVYNRRYLAKKHYLQEAEEKGDWSQYIWWHERPHRMEKFIDIRHNLSDQEYWELLGSIWSDSENLWQYGNTTLRWLLSADRPGKEGMMDQEERDFLAKLPDTFAIYRGHQTRNRLGFSWTLSYWKAKWFAHRFDHPKAGVVRGIVSKKAINAVLLGRNEYEIVVDPNHVDDAKTVRKLKRPAWMQAVLDESWAGYSLSKRVSYHGLWHWEKVEMNAISLAKQTPGCDHDVARLFALVHDAKRQNEDEDPLHGHRAADFAEKLFSEGKLHISKEQLGVLQEACCYHNDGQVSDNPTIGVCWDADRLDLTRVGITPDPALLSTKAGRELTWSV